MAQVFWGEITEVSNDKGPYKLIKVKSHDHPFDAVVMEPYGVQASPVVGGQALVTIVDNDLGKATAQILPPPKKRVDGQSEGELTLINHKTGKSIVIDKDGNVVINATTLKINADIEITGNITQTGDYSQTGEHVDNNGPHTA
ncbi:MAG: hypothetical protein RIC14_05700 [Filomicrobium sp.]